MNNKRGFTLIELLVVIAIIGVLMALILPAVQMVRESARRTHCMNNLYQVSMGLLHHESSKGRMPGYVDNMRTSTGTKTVSWVVKNLPYMERRDVYDKIANIGGPPADAPALPIMKCPSSAPFEYRTQVDYAGNAGSGTDKIWSSATGRLSLRQALGDGVFHDAVGGNGSSGRVHIPARLSLDMVADGDGTSNTIMLAERNMRCPERSSYLNTFQPGWVAPFHGTGGPTAFPLSALSPITIQLQWDIEYGTPINEVDVPVVGWKFPNGVHGGNFAMSMCDGSVRMLSMYIEESVYSQLMTSNSHMCSNGNNPNCVSHWNLPLLSEDMLYTE